MKKRKILCLLLASVFVVSMLPGCSKKAQETTESTAEVKENPKVKDEEKTDLTFIRPGQDPDNENDAANKAIKQYQEKYGVAVNIDRATYDDWTTKIFKAKTAGTPYDVIYGDNAFYPLFAMKHYTEPIQDYIDIDNDYVSKEGMDAYFKYNNEYYCVSSSTVSPSVLFYNKNMIEDNGLDDPLELYKQDKWTFDAFRDMCVKVTDKDQKIWGLSNWYAWFFLGANHTALCKISDDGKYELNFDDPAVKYSLEYTQDAYKTTGWRGVDGDSIFSSFYQGKNLFVNEYIWTETENLVKAKEDGRFDFDYGVVPLPYGPNNTDHYNVCNAGGYGIGNGCKTPYHAGQLIGMILKQNKIDSDIDNKNVPQDHLDLYKELAKKPYNDTYYDSAINCGQSLMNQVCGGTNVMTAMANLKNLYQGDLDDANDASTEV